MALHFFYNWVSEKTVATIRDYKHQVQSIKKSFYQFLFHIAVQFSIHPWAIPTYLLEAAGVNPRWHQARGWVHIGQVSSQSQGWHAATDSHSHSHLVIWEHVELMIHNSVSFLYRSSLPPTCWRFYLWFGSTERRLLLDRFQALHCVFWTSWCRRRAVRSMFLISNAQRRITCCASPASEVHWSTIPRNGCERKTKMAESAKVAESASCVHWRSSKINPPSNFTQSFCAKI